MKHHLADKAATAEPGRARRGTVPARSEAQPGATRHPILQLQSTIGNQAVNRLLQSGKLQTKRTVSRPGDTAVQRQESDEEELLQSSGDALQKQRGAFTAPPAHHPNRTGLPDHLKAGIESLSGFSMDDVTVHYNSSQPARLNALAYTQGTNIHVAPGQEQHLPHEAWHVVQQAQGRVQPTMQLKDSVPVNDDAGLEQEADVMGARVATMGDYGAFAGTEDMHTTDGMVQQLKAERAEGWLRSTDMAYRAPIQRARKTERQRSQQVSVWAEQLRSKVHLGAPDAMKLATAFAGSGTSFVPVEQFGGLIAERWVVEQVIILIRRFVSAAAGLSAEQWRTVASKGGAVDKPDLVATFARTGNGWTADNLAQLVTDFSANNGGLTAAQWVQIANVGNRLVNQPAAVVSFARLANWNAAGKLAAAQEFERNNGGLQATEFVAVATAHDALVDNAAAVGAFSRLAGWTASNKAALAGAWGPHAGTLSAVDCVTIVTAHLALANDIPCVISFATLAGWAVANKAALAALFGADPGGRTATDWHAIAEAHVALANMETSVALFARVGNRWTAANLRQYAVSFGMDDGGRTANDWTQLATAHIGLCDQEQVLAPIARAGWSAQKLSGLFTQTLAAGVSAPNLIGLLMIGGAPASSWAMVNAGWSAADLGTFIGTLLNSGLFPSTLATFMVTANVPAATFLMLGSWSAVPFAEFIVGVLNQNATPAALRLLMAEQGFPASSVALVAGAWGGTHVGEFCGGALVENMTATQIQTLIATVNVPAALQNMTQQGWPKNHLGIFCGRVHIGNVPVPTLLQLMQNASFCTGTVAMLTAHWTPVGLGDFVAGIVGTGLQVAAIATLTNTANFGAPSLAWTGAGFTDTEVGQICGQARLANGGAFTPAALTMFLGVGNSAANAFALKGAWGVNEIGTTIGYCRTQNGRPSDAQMVLLLARAAVAAGHGGAPVQAVWVRNAALAATGGAPSWAQVIAHLPRFQSYWVGPRIHQNWPYVTHNGLHGNYSLRIELRGERIEHVEAGHTFEYHLFTYANCTRQGVGTSGHASFVPVGTDVPQVLMNLQNSQFVRQIAENAAWGLQQTQGQWGSYKFGVLLSRVIQGNPKTYRTYISQCYPTAGINIVGKDLVAIGRFMGRIP